MKIDAESRRWLDGAWSTFGESEDFLTRYVEAPRTLKTGNGELADLGIGPSRITLVGAPPKYHKTDLACQIAVDAAREQPGLMAFIANAEMSPSTLMARQIARLSGVPLERFTQGEFCSLPNDVFDRVTDAKDVLQNIGTIDREVPEDICSLSEGRYSTAVQFCVPPFNTLSVACAVAEAEHYAFRRPDQLLLVVDYLQLFSAPDRLLFEKWQRYCQRKKYSIEPPMVRDVGAVMAELRTIAKTGVSIIVVSAMSRESYDKATVGGFRGSSEIEYAVDDAYVLARDEDRAGIMHLRHVASRNSATRDRILKIEGALHRFSTPE